jgi:hypothetical protein
MKFKIGDRAICTFAVTSRVAALCAPSGDLPCTIRAINKPYGYGVEIDNYPGHTCQGKVPNHHGWWVNEDDLIPDTIPMQDGLDDYNAIMAAATAYQSGTSGDRTASLPRRARRSRRTALSRS